MINGVIDLAYETADTTEQFVNSETSSHFHQIPAAEAANYRVMQTPRDSTNQAKMAEILMSLPPLGLKLHKPASFMNLIETRLFPEERPSFSADTNPKKASNADVFLLRIGTWQRVAQNKEDLVAKCYFAKRKLMWEILESGLKRKIQMHWEHILAIRAEIEETRPGILEIELSQPPSFFRETEPQPRKHTLWENASDFTDGQAMICRRHFLQFPPGVLDKLYEKLLQCEPRLFQMSLRPFPSLRSPYFDADLYNLGCSDIYFGCSGNALQSYSRGFSQVDEDVSLDSIRQTPYSSIRTPLPSVKKQFGQYYQMICSQSSIPSSDYSPTSVMDLSQPLDETISAKNAWMPSMAHWGQQADSYGDRFSTALPTIPRENPNVSDRNYDLRGIIDGEEAVLNNPHSLAMMGNERQFFNYSGMEVEMNCNNYEQESAGSESTDCRVYPQHVNWIELFNQNSVCPWM